MRINKTASILSLFCILGFFSNTTGFDFYAHSTIYYYNNIPITHSDRLFEIIVLPRYLFLSTLYEISSRIGVPIGITTTILILTPCYSIFKIIDKENIYNVLSLVIVIATFILSANYSGLFISILYILAFLLTKNPFFIIGGFFHPIGAVLMLGTLLITKQYYAIRVFSTILLTLLTFFYISTEFRLLTSNIDDNLRYSISNINDAIELLEISFDRKLPEFTIATSLSILFLLFKKKIKMRTKLRKSIDKSLIVTSIFIFTLSLNIYMWNRLNTNLPKSILTADINDVIYTAWFDWGEADINKSFIQLTNERLIGSGGLD
jgi:hypothetical protein